LLSKVFIREVDAPFLRQFKTLKIAIGVDESVCLSDIAYEIFRKAGIKDRIKHNIITHAHNCELY
jgi:hypothetical protein